MSDLGCDHNETFKIKKESHLDQWTIDPKHTGNQVSLHSLPMQVPVGVFLSKLLQRAVWARCKTLAPRLCRIFSLCSCLFSEGSTEGLAPEDGTKSSPHSNPATIWIVSVREGLCILRESRFLVLQEKHSESSNSHPPFPFQSCFRAQGKVETENLRWNVLGEAVSWSSVTA